jgi:hypothetical protein
MRLDKLEWFEAPNPVWDMAEFNGYEVVKRTKGDCDWAIEGEYCIYDPEVGRYIYWGLDEISAQAIVYELANNPQPARLL